MSKRQESVQVRYVNSTSRQIDRDRPLEGFGTGERCLEVQVEGRSLVLRITVQCADNLPDNIRLIARRFLRDALSEGVVVEYKCEHCHDTGDLGKNKHERTWDKCPYCGDGSATG